MIEKATPYAELNDVLRELVERVQVALGEQFLGAYLQGSFAVGDFDEHSDVDFIIAVRDEPADDQLTRAAGLARGDLTTAVSSWLAGRP